MTIDREAHVMLRAWGVWVQDGRRARGSRGLVFDYGMTRAPDRGDGPVSGYVPIDELACASVEAFVVALPIELRDVVHECYLHETTAERHAARLRMSKRTMYARLGHAWDRFDAWMTERRDRKKNFV